MTTDDRSTSNTSTSNTSAAARPVALVTGASTGLGLALAGTLVGQGWHVVIDARSRPALQAAAGYLGPLAVAVPGDVTDPAHRHDLADAVAGLGRLDLLVNNASGLGPSPLPPLADYPLDELEDVYRVNLLAPLALIQLTLPLLRVSGGTILNVSSDAAVEAYAGWGGYGSSKAALDQVTAVLAVELTADLAAALPSLRVYSFDPGDLRTALHQRAYPGEDISDRPDPASVVPALLTLINERPPSGRYRAAELLTANPAGVDASVRTA